MPSLKPPKGYKRGLSDRTCRDMAERALMSPLGQEALRQGWGHGLFRFVMAWGSTPSRPETKAAIKRQANEFMWELGDMRAIRKPCQREQAEISLYEARAKAEEGLKRKYLRSNADG